MRIGAETLAAYVETHPGITPDALADYIGVSVRTVRTYVNQINRTMSGFAAIKLNRKSGYHMEISDPYAYDTWREGVGASSAVQTPKARLVLLLNDLLMRNDWVKLDDLSRLMFVSRGTVSNDLKHAQEFLDGYGLSIETRPHYGIRITGPELSRRICLANVIVDRFNDAMGDIESETNRSLDTLFSRLFKDRQEPDPDANAGDGADAGSDPTLDIVSDCVSRVIREEHFQINTAAYRNLIVHIAVALVRIQEHCYVPMASDQLDQMKGTDEFRVAEKIVAAIEGALGQESLLPEEEIAYISIHLAGKRMMLGDSPKDEGLIITDDVWHVVEEMIECVWKAFRFDFRNDLELHMNLARHIVPLAVRLRYRMNLKNPLIDDIKKRYALAYSMAMDASIVLARKYGAEVSEDEIGYIALAFALALERQKSKIPKKNILVVCASGAGSAHLLEYRCRREFADYVDRIFTCDLMGIDNVDFSHIDYVFTTVPINRKLPVPVREVSYFLGDDEVIDMRLVLDSRSKPGKVPPYFKRSLFFPHMTLTSKRKVLDFLLDRTCETCSVASNFREFVWKREALVPTSFGNRVATPHPIEAASDETFICVGLLDHPVAWDADDQPVQAVFLLGFSDKNRNGEMPLHEFMSAFASLLADKEAVDTLLRRQNWETLMALLESALSGEPDGSPGT